MRRRIRNVSVAYPGPLGPAVPTPPPGYVFLVTRLQGADPEDNPDYLIPAPYSDFDQYVYLTDDAGALLTVEAT